MDPEQLELGQLLRDEGVARAELAEPGEWKERAERGILELARTRPLGFTSDDLRDLIGDPLHPNAMGAAFRRASQAGIIERVGFRQAERSERHASTLGIWREVR